MHLRPKSIWYTNYRFYNKGYLQRVSRNKWLFLSFKKFFSVFLVQFFANDGVDWKSHSIWQKLSPPSRRKHSKGQGIDSPCFLVRWHSNLQRESWEDFPVSTCSLQVHSVGEPGGIHCPAGTGTNGFTAGAPLPLSEATPVGVLLHYSWLNYSRGP